MTDARAATPPEGDLRDPAVRSAVYRDLHRHPELAFAEHRTVGILADHLARLGFEVHGCFGGTGVVGVLSRGPAPTVLLRADMDALPVTEETGLPYASDADVMHACGHDVHVTCLLGAAATLAADPRWTGTLLTAFQPAEEIGAGARAMVDDGLYDRVPIPDVVLGQHVVPMPAGVLGPHAGTAFAASDALTVTLHVRTRILAAASSPPHPRRHRADRAGRGRDRRCTACARDRVWLRLPCGGQRRRGGGPCRRRAAGPAGPGRRSRGGHGE